MKKRNVNYAIAVIILSVSIAWARADVALVKDGRAQAAIHVSAEVMAEDKKDVPQAFEAQTKEEQRRRLRDSVKDLAHYLEKISGARIEVVTGNPGTGDKRLPILIDELAAEKFGPPTKTAPFRQGFRLVVSAQGIGLMGESDLATSYAIYELLDRLGCRWYMPSELGEVIPQRKTIAFPETDESLTPGTLNRQVGCLSHGLGDGAEFGRRNREGGVPLNASHSQESSWLTKEQLDAHPEWLGLVAGKRTPHRFCWANAEGTAAVADGIVARLDKEYYPVISLSPNDGSDFCECDKCKAIIQAANDWDPSCGRLSDTDLFLRFANQIAERVTKDYPDVMFGFLAYGTTMRVPVREKIHPNLVPMIAPMTYCRAHTMQQTNCPTRPMMRSIVEAWGRKVKHISYYNYMYHLAEMAVPYPMIKQMSDELPIIFANGVDFWQPELVMNHAVSLPGKVIASRMCWNPKAKPEEILGEFFTKFYGAAAGPMRRYWQFIDDTWTKVPEHTGCGFGYPKRFTRERMKEARKLMDAALAACKTDVERRRVKIHDESLRHFDNFMKMRWDLFEGRLAGLDKRSVEWVAKDMALCRDYVDQRAFGYTEPNSPLPKEPTYLMPGSYYYPGFWDPAYKDAGRVARDFTVISPPLRKWRYQMDKDKKGESLSWQQAEFKDGDWKITDPCVDTWSNMLGLDMHMGTMFYRTKVKVPEAPAGKKIYLWISSMDGSAKVFVNGQHIPYVNEKGEKENEFGAAPVNRFCQPASFDITSAAKPKTENQITIIGTHWFGNELGTGGLIGPVFLYREK